jgi:hypothetical protein
MRRSEANDNTGRTELFASARNGKKLAHDTEKCEGSHEIGNELSGFIKRAQSLE